MTFTTILHYTVLGRCTLLTHFHCITETSHAQKGVMFPPDFEPGIFLVLGECNNHYTSETAHACF